MSSGRRLALRPVLPILADMWQKTFLRRAFSMMTSIPPTQNRRKSRLRNLAAAAAGIMALALTGCGGDAPTPASSTNATAPRGESILATARSTNAGSLPPQTTPASKGKAPAARSGDFLPLSWDKLSSYKYELYEVGSETNSGRPFLKSDDTIPPDVKLLDSQQVTVRGFVLSLRNRRGRISDFLLLRDQGTCCFGEKAQINHYIRVKYREGIPNTANGAEITVSGVLHVGETYVGGYLTGIYHLDLEKVDLDASGTPP